MEERKKIWKTPFDLKLLNKMMVPGTLLETLEMKFTEIGNNYLVATMPVKELTHQPLQLLHGGASAALAESVGSAAANLAVDQNSHYAVGLSINASHLRPKREGIVSGKATPVHLGKTTQVWEIIISDEKNRKICISRLTMAVLEKKTEFMKEKHKFDT